MVCIKQYKYSMTPSMCGAGHGQAGHERDQIQLKDDRCESGLDRNYLSMPVVKYKKRKCVKNSGPPFSAV